MKNLKKITKENLKSIKGGIDFCKAGYMYVCEDINVCDPMLGVPCSCRCIPIV